MKKTTTLFATVVLFTAAAFAQYDHPRDNNYGNNQDRDMAVNNNRGNGYGNNRGTYYFTAKEKNIQIALITRDYNRKIESVKNKVFMGRSKKAEIIYSLKLQRDAEVRFVIAKFNDRRNRFDKRDDRYYDNDRRNKW